MKQLNITILLTVIMSMFGAKAYAHDIEVANKDGVTIYYNWINDNTELSVTYCGNNDSYSNEYSGDIFIPNSIEYDEKTYSVTIIGDYAFYGCTGLTSIKIPNSVTIIGVDAFAGCTNLTSIEIPNSVTGIGGWAFWDCTSLTSVKIPDNLTIMGANLFDNCISLTSIEIPNSVTRITTGAFRHCDGLISVKIPTSVTRIGEMAFQDCSGLTSIDIPDSVTEIEDSAFARCTSLTSIVIPKSVTRIVIGAFYGCTSLTSVSIGSDTQIGGSAFQYCTSLTSISIGSGTTLIGALAFANCKELTDVCCYAENVPETSSDAFKNSYPQNITLHVPESALDDYKATNPWIKFKEIVALPNYTLTYIVDGEVYKTFKYEEGRTVPEEPEPTKEGYIFSGWSDIPETMPAENVTITGEFKEKPDDGEIDTEHLDEENEHIGDLEVDEIQINSSGKNTYCSLYDLDFTGIEGVKAFIASGYNDDTKILWLTRVNNVPAGTGIMLKGEAGSTYKIPHIKTHSCYANYFKGNADGKITINETDGDMTNYYMKNGQFVSVKGTATISANRCYLQLPTSVFAGTRTIEVIYDDEEEGTTSIYNSQIKINSFDEWYDLQGRRINAQPTKKGIYIHSGKKVVIK